jgi:D-alanyl-D-alanine carboxypeptidase
MRRIARSFVPMLAVFVLAAHVAAGADAALEPPLRAAIDAAARDALAATGAPSASVAVVRGGAIAYVQAYGSARLDPAEAARPAMRYSIGSVSKQFTATAILMLADEGKLSLDDPVGKFVPGLTKGDVVTIRQILSHTSGYQDYWPQDYVPPFMLQPTAATAILDRWAKKPLDFEPGAEYQYSNTGYVLAGLIVEKASGRPLLPFLTERIFRPLGMTSVANIDQERLGDTDPTGYLRYALGPPRVAPKEGKGWLFAAGELAMTAEDLARWNVAMLQQKLLKPESYRQQQREVLRTDGLGISYGLGVDVTRRGGHRLLAHGGEVSGFTASNLVFPDDDVAVTVLVNQDSIDTSGNLAGRIADLLLVKGGAEPAEARARRILRSEADTLDRPRRNDLPALRGEVPAEEDRDLGTRHAGREDRAVPGDGDGVAVRAASSATAEISRHVVTVTSAEGFGEKKCGPGLGSRAAEGLPPLRL